MTDAKAIRAYNKVLDKPAREICDALFDLIDTTIAKGESKVWHGAPVWFIDGNVVKNRKLVKLTSF